MTSEWDLDYPTLARWSFVLGIGLFLLGAVGSAVGHAVFGTLPGWETTLFVDAEMLGIAVALFGGLGFGIILPLTE